MWMLLTMITIIKLPEIDLDSGEEREREIC